MGQLKYYALSIENHFIKSFLFLSNRSTIIFVFNGVSLGLNVRHFASLSVMMSLYFRQT